jgi:pimeloyl-ACP methyl ester carboxylesterase
MIEQEVAFTSEELRLSGTLALPQADGRYPCVLMIPGSGRVDRNENLKRLPINVFGELSRHLADRGVGSLRYDKRGVGSSQGDYWTKGFYDSASDATAALLSLRAQPQVDAGKIFLLGHSEGAYVAALLAARQAGIAGAILLAGGARPGEEEMKWQAIQVAAGLTGLNRWLLRLLRIDVAKSQQKQLDKIKRSASDSYRVQLRKINAKWLREFLAYDPSPDLATIRIPVLAITGGKDIQVDPANLSRMAELVQGPFEYHVVPDVSHLLRPENGPPTLSTYKKQVREPIDPRVVALIVRWLEQEIEGPVADG